MTASPDSKLTTNETTRLLQRVTSDIDSDDENSSQSSDSRGSSINNLSPVTAYGSLIKSDEEQHGAGSKPGEPAQKVYSNGFIAKVVIALLVGELRGFMM